MAIPKPYTAWGCDGKSHSKHPVTNFMLQTAPSCAPLFFVTSICAGTLLTRFRCRSAAGVVSEAGACCTAPAGQPVTLDRGGGCCGGRLDACGVCGGTGAAVDITGACCSGSLDAGVRSVVALQSLKRCVINICITIIHSDQRHPNEEPIHRLRLRFLNDSCANQAGAAACRPRRWTTSACVAAIPPPACYS